MALAWVSGVGAGYLGGNRHTAVSAKAQRRVESNGGTSGGKRRSRGIVQARDLQSTESEAPAVASNLLGRVNGQVKKVLGVRDENEVNPYLSGNFAPVHREVPEGVVLEIDVGELPEAVNGAYMRVGPNPKFRPRKGYHWFDGDGMVHTVRIKDGSAVYANRYVRTQRFQMEEEKGREYYMKMGAARGVLGMGNMIAYRMAKRLGLFPSGSDGVANTSIVYHAGKVMAMHEGDIPYALRVLCNGVIETAGALTDVENYVSTFTAHPKTDPETKELVFLSYTFNSPPYAKVGFMDPAGQMQKVIDINGLERGVMMHDMGLTEHYAVVMDTPLVFDPKEMVSNGGFPLQIRRDLPVRFGLLPRSATSDKDMKWVEIPGGCWAVHTANAWEDAQTGKVHIVTSRVNSFDDGSNSTGDVNDVISKMVMWTLDVESGRGTCTQLLPEGVFADFPVINNNYLGRKTRFCWCSKFEEGHPPKFEGMVKIDMEAAAAGGGREAVSTLLHGPQCYGGEMSFVPRSADPSKCDGEDDGYLVGYIHDEAKNVSYFVVYDAKTMSSEPVCRLKIPKRVPYGFHGLHVATEELQAQL